MVTWWRKFGRIARLIVLLLVWPRSPAAALTLVSNGQAQATIVVSAAALHPAEDDKIAQKIGVAAHDLQEYLQKISGARLSIVGDDTTPHGAAILVGASRLTAQIKVEIPDGLTPDRREEGFVIVCAGNRLLLADNDRGPYHGTEYATYELLERLGVRWYMPGEFGEIVPQRATIAVADITVRQRPDFIVRSWWNHLPADLAPIERRWKIRNKLDPDEVFAVPGDSTIRDFVADEKYVKTNPEYFARRADGSVDPYLPNLSNPKAVEIAAEKIKARFRAHPELHSIGLAPDDGLPRDFNAETKQLNQNFSELGGRQGEATEVSTSEEWFRFINAVVREVKREFPDRVIATNGYANRDIPPQGVDIDPNISIMYAAIWSDTLHAYDDPKSWQMIRQGQNVQRWAKLSNKVWLYNYTETMMVSALTPVPLTRKLARDLPLLKKWGVAGMSDESRNIWAEAGITTKYLRARLEWNTSLDVGALLAEFFAHWYGAAAGPARAFWDEIESAIESAPMLGHEDRVLTDIYTPRLLDVLKRDVETAERLADTDRTRLHVRADRLIYEHLRAYMEMTASELAGDFSGAAAHADRMMAVRAELHAINPFFIMPTEQGLESGIWYWGVTARAAYYRKLADATTGKTGDLVAVLPERADFRLDPTDEGRFAGWSEPGGGSTGWTSVLTTRPFYAQGHMSAQGYPYTGTIWYRLKVNVPRSARGRIVQLVAPVMETEAWVWVNGRYVGHRPYREAYERPNELLLDVTAAIRPGDANEIVIRVDTSLNAAAAGGGLRSRLVLFSPKPK